MPFESFDSEDVMIVGIDRLAFLEYSARHFKEQSETLFTAAFGLEFLCLQQYNKTETGGATIFTELEKVARQNGVRPDGTFGSLTTLVGIDQSDAHVIGCACNGEKVSGAVVASRIKHLIAKYS